MAATHRHPAFVARMQADLDWAMGALILGVGSGWFQAEYAMMNLDFPGIGRRQKDLDELIEVVDGLWLGAPYTHHGETFDIDGMQITRATAACAGWRQRKERHVASGCYLGRCLQCQRGGEGRRRNDAERFAQAGNAAALDGHLDDLGRPRNEVLKSHFTSMLCLRPHR
ncbi:MAG: LLM class flavin-dependent oxidoreductase [Thermomicrobiales bacterium]